MVQMRRLLLGVALPAPAPRVGDAALADADLEVAIDAKLAQELERLPEGAPKAELGAPRARLEGERQEAASAGAVQRAQLRQVDLDRAGAVGQVTIDLAIDVFHRRFIELAIEGADESFFG